MKTTREAAIQHAIREALGLESDLVLFRNTVGKTTEFDAKTHETRVITYGLGVGSADLVGALKPHGRWFCLEVKKPSETSTPDQLRWANLVRSFGGFVAEAHSPDEARAALARARTGAAR